jgi:tRNA-splicing ligase RtcB (3'-phosphate/5'-hydroxy nucleic acid ligase)
MKRLFAYKDIEEVMKSQKALVDIVRKFMPKIVMMNGQSTKRGERREIMRLVNSQ